MPDLVIGHLQENNEIRKNIKKMMIDLDIDNHKAGGYRGLLPRLSERMGRTISAQMLSNAITGYQTGQSARELLTVVKEILESWSAPVS
jgi:hypothetical protein